MICIWRCQALQVSASKKLAAGAPGTAGETGTPGSAGSGFSRLGVRGRLRDWGASAAFLRNLRLKYELLVRTVNIVLCSLQWKIVYPIRDFHFHSDFLLSQNIKFEYRKHVTLSLIPLLFCICTISWWSHPGLRFYFSLETSDPRVISLALLLSCLLPTQTSRLTFQTSPPLYFYSRILYPADSLTFSWTFDKSLKIKIGKLFTSPKPCSPITHPQHSVHQEAFCPPKVTFLLILKYLQLFITKLLWKVRNPT